MAMSVFNIFEINSAATASNVNGGGFNPNNANMLTNLTATSADTSAPVCSSASYNFVAGDVGHWLYIKSGTNWTPGWYKIASVAANAATLSAAIGSANVRQVVSNRFIANTVVGCATTASPTGGTFTIDYSQSTASPFASTDLAALLATSAAPTITSATNPFGKNMVGNLIHITAGTNWTQSWYEIVSVTTVTATLDRACASVASPTAGTGKVGGALSLGSSDDAVFELASATSGTGATRYFIKGNATYTLGGAVAGSKSGGDRSPFIIEGYATNRGDRPTGSTMPIIACGANNTSFFAQTETYISLSVTGTGTSLLAFDKGVMLYCKIKNTSTTADRIALQMSGAGTQIIASEVICYRGVAVNTGGTPKQIIGCNIHHSNIGIDNLIGTTVLNNIISNNVTTAVNINTNSTAACIAGNVLYGGETPIGTGISVGTGGLQETLINNIIAGFVTGINPQESQTANFDDFNDYYNNTNDIGDTTGWQKGASDLALNPTFTSVQERTGSTATTAASNVFTQSGATFQTWGVTAGTHYIYISAGTGVTAGIYGITSVDSETQLTLDVTLGANATADKVWRITTGLNWQIGTNLKAAGTPGAFAGTSTTGYMDIGAAQRQEAAATGGSFTFG